MVSWIGSRLPLADGKWALDLGVEAKTPRGLNAGAVSLEYVCGVYCTALTLGLIKEYFSSSFKA